MSTSPVSRVNAAHPPQPVHNQTAPHKKQNTSEPPTDTVHLSPEAQAHLKKLQAEGQGH